MNMATTRRSVAATLCALGATSRAARAPRRRSTSTARRRRRSRSGGSPTPSTWRRSPTCSRATRCRRSHFVPDAKVLGFVNLSSSQTGSLVRMEQYETTAFAIAQTVTADPTTLTGCDAAAQDEADLRRAVPGRLRQARLPAPADRRREDGLMALLARDAETVAYPTRLAMVVQAMLLSPKFLFRPEIGDRSQQVAQGVPLTSWEMATRLSYFLTGTIPDAELAARGRRRAAADGGRDDQAGAPAADLAARAGAAGEVPHDVAGHRHHRRRWPRTRTRSRTSLRCSPTTWRRRPISSCARRCSRTGGTFADLMLADHTYVNGPLAEFYGLARRPDNADDWVPRAARHQPAGRPADAGVAAGDDGEGGSHRPGPARQVRAEPDPVPVGPAAAARDRGDVQAAGSQQDRA